MERVEVLDHGYVQAVEFWGSDERVIESARMSTGKGFNGWGPFECEVCRGTGSVPNPDDATNRHGPVYNCEVCAGQGKKPGDEKLLRYLWENKHSTPFEMAGATFEVQAPIFVFREWHRHRVPFGYSEASARYAPLPDLNYVPTVERIMLGGGHLTKQAGAAEGAVVLTKELAEGFRIGLGVHYEMAEEEYQRALRNGIPKELARVLLPVGRYSKMRATGNLRGWLAFLELRNAPTAQYEIRVYAEAVQAMLAEKFPRTLALFAEKR